MGTRQSPVVGLMGGMFDPIHIGHLNCADEAAHAFGLEAVFFIPSAAPPHKKRGHASAEDRFAMTQMAIQSHPRFVASRIEMDRASTSYSIDTIRAFRKIAGKNLYFIIGIDAFGEIHTWKAAERLFDACNFIVIPRPGNDMETLRTALAKCFAEKKTARKITARRGGPTGRYLKVSGSPYAVYPCATVQLDVSSTALRGRIREGKPIKYLVPEIVERYILKTGLYI